MQFRYAYLAVFALIAFATFPVAELRQTQISDFNKAYAANKSARLNAPLQTGCAPTPAGMIAWYRGEGNADDAAIGNHGSLRNASYTTGRVGRAFNLGKVGSAYGEVFIPTAKSLNPNRISLEGWVYPRTNYGSANIIINKEDDPYTSFQYEIAIEPVCS